MNYNKLCACVAEDAIHPNFEHSLGQARLCQSPRHPGYHPVHLCVDQRSRAELSHEPCWQMHQFLLLMAIAFSVCEPASTVRAGDDGPPGVASILPQ